jgi:CBS domain-containing protein
MAVIEDGRSIMQVRELVGGAVSACNPETTIRDAASAMFDASVGSMAVIERDRLVGIITERDVVRCVGEGGDPAVDPVRRWMTADPDVVSPDIDVAAAADWLLATGYRHLPVVEGSNLLGVLSIKDVLWGISAPSNQ